MSSLRPGAETNAGLFYKLLHEVAQLNHLSLRYEAGIQWQRWRDVRDIVEGRGINRQIRKTYGFIASRYRPGDRIFLLGYSRGAYAVRSLAGVIDRVGLLKPEYATVRHIRQAYRYYRQDASGQAFDDFKHLYCHDAVEIEMVGVWDTVKALGLRLPFLCRWTEAPHRFHNHKLGGHIRHGFHALALDETREAYSPVLWETWPEFPGVVEQVWFRGSHGDVGGHLRGFAAARPLANISLNWMLEKADARGLPLPEGWRNRFPQDPDAPSAGNKLGWGVLFLARKKRLICQDPSEALHPTAKSFSATAPEPDGETPGTPA